MAEPRREFKADAHSRPRSIGEIGSRSTELQLSLLSSLLKIDAREVEFPRRGFTCASPGVRAHLERAGEYFLEGYHAALEQADQQSLAAQLNRIEPLCRGFAFEGAAMALALLDALLPWRSGFMRFAAGAGAAHIYMLHVGAGWACARLPWLRRRIEAATANLHPLFRRLAIDGYGFHEGYFHGHREARHRIARAPVSEPARHIFYQGLGRSLWFQCGANPEAIGETIADFPLQYREDAWSGAGLACAYAGGVSSEEVKDLRLRSGRYAMSLAQGAAFAAKARQLADTPARHTEIACAILCGMPAANAASLCDETMGQVNMGLIDPAHPCPYQQWRALLRDRLASSFRSPSSTSFPRGTSNATDSVLAASADFESRGRADCDLPVLPGARYRHFRL
jgi:hypothetical protein